MISLNVIAPEKKAEYRLMQLYLVVKNVIMLMLIFSIIVAIILLTAKITLENYFNQIVADTTLTTRYANIFSGDIKSFNLQLGAVEGIQKNYIRWTAFLQKISAATPKNISLDSLEIHDNKMLITGFASSRDQLLQYKNNLDALLVLSNVTAPLEDLIKKENINFTIKADVILSDLH